MNKLEHLRSRSEQSKTDSTGEIPEREQLPQFTFRRSLRWLGSNPGLKGVIIGVLLGSASTMGSFLLTNQAEIFNAVAKSPEEVRPVLAGKVLAILVDLQIFAIPTIYGIAWGIGKARVLESTVNKISPLPPD